MPEIPNPFGGFAPFPNSIMIPFMGYQSAVLGYEFGVNYEVGKRTVKAMDNDLFNKIVAGQGSELEGGKITVNYNGQAYELDNYSEYLPLLSRLHSEQMITNFRNALPDAMSVMNDIIHQSVEIEKLKAQRTPSAFREIFEAFTTGFSSQQTTDIANFFGTLGDSFSRLLGWFGLNTLGSTEPTTETPLWYEPSDTTTTGNNWDTVTSFNLTIQDPILGFTRTYKTCPMHFDGHVQQYNLLYENPGVASSDCDGSSFSGTAMSHVVGKYKDAINFFYYNNP